MTDTRDRIRKAAREGWRTDRDGIYDGIRAPWDQWIVREHGDYIAIDGASLDVSQIRELAAQLVAVADAMEPPEPNTLTTDRLPHSAPLPMRTTDIALPDRLDHPDREPDTE